MNKEEAKITLRLKAWLRDEIGMGAFEIKSTRGGKHFNLKELRTHQRDALMAASSPFGYVYKISDESRGFKPFDCFVLKNAKAFVVICFPEAAYAIDIHRLLQVRSPSIDAGQAMRMASYEIAIKDL